MIIYYYNRYGKKIEFKAANKKEYELIKIELFERNVVEDIGSVYTLDNEGNEKELCYYND